MSDLDTFDFAPSYLHNGRQGPPSRVLAPSEQRAFNVALDSLRRAGVESEHAIAFLHEAGLRPPSGTEVGVANFGAVDFNGELLEPSDQVPITKLQRMTRFDGQAKALLNILTMPVRTAKWQIVPSKDGVRESKFITDMLTRPPHRGGMSIPFGSTLAYLALAIRDRFKVVEKVWELRRVDGELRYILKKLAPRPTETLKIKVDKAGDFIGVHQETNFHGQFIDVQIPKHKLLLYTYGKEEAPLSGESAFNAAHYHYDKKHKLYYIAHIAYTVAALPPRVGTIPQGVTNSNEIAAFRTNLSSLGLNTAITVPAGWEVDTLQLNRSFADFMPLINHHDFMMAISVLAQFLRLGQTGVGAFALSSDQSDVFVTAMQHFLDDIASVVTSYLLPDIVDLNFGTQKYPTFKFETLSDKATNLIRELFGKLAVTQNPTVTGEFLIEVEKRMAEILGLSIDYESIEKELEEIAEAEREQALKMAKNPPTVPGQPGSPPSVKPKVPEPTGANNG